MDPNFYIFFQERQLPLLVYLLFITFNFSFNLASCVVSSPEELCCFRVVICAFVKTATITTSPVVLIVEQDALEQKRFSCEPIRFQSWHGTQTTKSDHSVPYSPATQLTNIVDHRSWTFSMALWYFRCFVTNCWFSSARFIFPSIVECTSFLYMIIYLL